MTKRILLSLLATSTLTMMAATLTPEQALQRVRNSSHKVVARNASAMKLAYTMNSEAGEPTLYVFNNSGNSGYILLSADDAAAPMLGYSDNGSFDPQLMSPTMKWWLEQYSSLIEFSSSNNSRKYSSANKVAGAAISPLLSTKWNQTKPYNNDCPQINGVNCVTGCVATAMAQVMAYHKYPDVGTGTVSATANSTSYSLDLSEQSFDWNNMLDQYVDGQYTDAQAEAVAYLMKACGYSVSMIYSTSESGAVSMNIGSALIDNFGYNKNISYEKRMFYSTTDWEQMIYDELNAKRPVLYGGQSEGGGHQFVCDGYDGNGYFHINWGWGGLSDGYFLLQSLNPDDLGVGGGTGGGYSFDQDIIIGVQPTTTSTSQTLKLMQYGSLTGNKTSTSTIAVKATGTSAGWWNMNYSDLHISFGVIIEDVSNSAADKTNVVGQITSGTASQSLSNFTLKTRYGIGGSNGFSFNFPTSLGDGTYKVTVAFLNLDDDTAEWQPVTSSISCPNYFTVVKSGTSYSITWESVKTLTVVDAEVLTPLYVGANAKMSVQLKNNTDVELTETVYPVLYKQGENQFMGTGVPVTLKPGESVTKEFITNFSLIVTGVRITSATTYSLRFYNEDTDTNYDDFKMDVTLNPTSSPILSATDLTVPGASTTTDSSGNTVYLIEDPSNFPVEATVTCSMGYFASEVIAFVFPYTGGISLTSCDMLPYLFLSAGESQKVNGTFYFDSAVDGDTYFILLYRYNGSSYVQIPGNRIYITSSYSAVNEIGADDNLILAYNKYCDSLIVSSSLGIRNVSLLSMNGTTVWSYNGTDTELEHSVGDLPAGVYVVVAEDMNGKQKSLKFLK